MVKNHEKGTQFTLYNLVLIYCNIHFHRLMAAAIKKSQVPKNVRSRPTEIPMELDPMPIKDTVVHAVNCQEGSGKCYIYGCVSIQGHITHMKSCILEECPEPICAYYHKVVRHKESCKNTECSFCANLMKTVDDIKVNL